jgi:hypothetical protein
MREINESNCKETSRLTYIQENFHDMEIGLRQGQ